MHVALTASPEVVDLDQVPVERLLAFRHDHLDKIVAFRAHLSGLDDKLLALAAVYEPEALRKRLRELYRQETEPLLNDLRDAMHRFRFRTVLGTLALKVDTETAGAALGVLAAAPIVTAFEAPAAAVALPAAIAMAVVPYLAQRRAVRRQQASSSVSFLLTAGQNLSAEQIVRDMRR